MHCRDAPAQSLGGIRFKLANIDSAGGAFTRVDEEVDDPAVGFAFGVVGDVGLLCGWRAGPDGTEDNLMGPGVEGVEALLAHCCFKQESGKNEVEDRDV